MPFGPSGLHPGPLTPRVYVGAESVSAHKLSGRDSYTNNSFYCHHSYPSPSLHVLGTDRNHNLNTFKRSVIPAIMSVLLDGRAARIPSMAPSHWV